MSFELINIIECSYWWCQLKAHQNGTFVVNAESFYVIVYRF